MIKKVYLLVFLSVLLTLPGFLASAADEGIVQCGGEGQERCEISDLGNMIGRIIDIIMRTIVPSVAVLCLIIGGIVILVSAGNPNLKSLGKNIIVTTIIGMAIVYLAYLIINTIVTTIAPGLDWSTIF